MSYEVVRIRKAGNGFVLMDGDLSSGTEGGTLVARNHAELAALLQERWPEPEHVNGMSMAPREHVFPEEAMRALDTVAHFVDEHTGEGS